MRRPLRILALSLAAGLLPVPPQGTASAPAAPLGRLDWGRNPRGGRPWTDAALRGRIASGPLATTTGRLLGDARNTLGEPVEAVPQIFSQGLLASDPRRDISRSALQKIPHIFRWAVCARLALPSVSLPCLQQASAGVDAWASTYRPNGDPINESALVPLILSIDLLSVFATPAQQKLRRDWLLRLADAGDQLSETWIVVNPPKRVNNWNAWRLLLRGLAAELAGDARMKSETRELVSGFVAKNILDDGSSTDFHARDALHYHLYDVLPLVELATLAPDLVDAKTTARIESGVEFLRPYYTGELQHTEFVHTKVHFDIQRRDAGQKGYANAGWDPKTAGPLLGLASARFPSVAAWVGDLDPEPNPALALVAALHAGR